MRYAFAFLSVLLLASPAAAAKRPKLPYDYARVGSTADVHTLTIPGTVMMGGNTDVDAAFQWMCALAGNGDFLVIRATGTDAYNPYIQSLPGCLLPRNPAARSTRSGKQFRADLRG